jgi:hypothetical protein
MKAAGHGRSEVGRPRPWGSRQNDGVEVRIQDVPPGFIPSELSLTGAVELFTEGCLEEPRRLSKVIGIEVAQGDNPDRWVRRGRLTRCPGTPSAAADQADTDPVAAAGPEPTRWKDASGSGTGCPH